MASENRGGSAGRTVLLLGESAETRQLKSKLTAQGYQVVGSAATTAAAERLLKSRDPHVLVLQLSADRLAQARSLAGLLSERRRPLIATASSAEPQLIAAACDLGACGFLIEPVTAEALSAQIEVSLRRFHDLEKLLQEKADLAQDLETRKLVERAKAILMTRAGLSEPDAHRRLQQESQKRRMTMAETALRIIESDEIMGRGG